MLTNSKHSYGLISITLHWLIALLIIGLFASGLYMTELDYYHPLYQKLPHYHESLGILLTVLLLARVLLLWLQPRPQVLSSGWQQRLARAMHIVLYLLPVLVVVFGYLLSSAEGQAIAVFNWFSLAAIDMNIEYQADIFGWLHYYVAIALLVLAGGHALAALKHHFIDKDTTLKRMLTSNNQPEDKS